MPRSMLRWSSHLRLPPSRVTGFFGFDCILFSTDTFLFSPTRQANKFVFSTSEVMLSYLPLAHIFQQARKRG